MAVTPDIRVSLRVDGATEAVTQFNRVTAGAKSLGASVASALNPFNSLKAAVGGLGLTALAAGFVAVSKNVVAFSDLAGKAGERIGTTAEAFSTLAAAAELAEVGTEGLENSLGILAKNVSGLKNGTSSAADSLKELGLSAANFAGKDTAQSFELVAQRLFKVKDGGDRARLAMDIFGKSGRALLPLMREVAEQGLAAMTEEAERLGVLVSGKASADADKFGDNLTRLGQAAKGSARRFVDDLLPGLNDVTAAMVEAAKEGGILKSLLVGFGGVVSLIINGSEVSQAKKAVDEAAALVEESKKLVASGRVPIPGLGFLGIDLKANEKATEGLKRVLGEREQILIAARARLTELTKPPEKKEGGGGDLEEFDAAKRVAELTKTLRLDELKSSEAASDRQRAITEAQIKNEEALLAARQTGAAGQQAVDRAAFQSIAARTALEKQAFNDDMAGIELRQRAIAASVAKEVAALSAEGKNTKQQQAVLVELNKQSLDQRLALTQTHYQKLLALQAEYVAKYKASSEAIKSIDKEIADNRLALTSANTQEDLSGLSEAEKVSALRRKGVELEAQQFRAAAAGNVDETRKLKDELLAVNKALVDLGAFKLGREFGESGVATLEKLLEKQRAAELNNQALAKSGIAGVGEQLKTTGNEIQTFFKERLGLIDLKFGADQQALTSLVDSLRERLGKEVFPIKVSAGLAGGGSVPGLASGGRILGVSPSMRADDKLIWATSGEFMQPVRAVRHYGVDFMESIRQMQFPKMADGGVVGGGSGSAPSGPVHHVDLSFNKRPIGRMSGARDTVNALLDALSEVERGTK